MKFLTAIFLMAATLAAQADLLYWQVGSPAETTDGKKLNYTYASIYKVGSVDALMLIGMNIPSESKVDVAAAGSLVAAEIGDRTASQSFFIELYDANFDKVGHSETVSSGDLSAYMSAAAFNQNWTSANAWTGGTFTSTAVPEPTSGLLLLIGAAMMGLRRKRIA